MKKMALTVCVFFSLQLLMAQNVGIGDVSPTSKLSIRGADATANGQNAALKIGNSASGGANWYLRAGATGTSTPAGGFSIGNDAGYRLTISSVGNVGIGTVTPTARLHISGGGIKIEGSGALEFGVGVSKEINAGKITYGNYSANILEITGGGLTAGTRSIRFFNEGVAWFEGPLYLASGNVTRQSTGPANLLPIAFGSVNTDGSVIGGTGNFTCLRSAPGYYIITVANEFVTEAGYTIIATVLRNSISGGDYAWAHASTSSPGKFYVIMDRTEDQKFSFMLYKNN